MPLLGLEYKILTEAIFILGFYWKPAINFQDFGMAFLGKTMQPFTLRISLIKFIFFKFLNLFSTNLLAGKLNILCKKITPDRFFLSFFH